MKRSAFVYAVLISIVGILLGAYSVVQSVRSVQVANLFNEALEFGTLMGLFIICRSLPLQINDESAIDMSLIILFASMLLRGANDTVTMIVISVPLIFEVEDVKKKRKPLRILNVSPIKTLFNMANPVIAVSAAGCVFRFVGGRLGELTLPFILWPSFLFILVIIFLNSSILYLLLKFIDHTPFFSSILRDFVQLLPSWMASAPIGYFIGFLMQMPSGPYLTILFMLPLLLARYAFKQYLDGRKQYFNLINTLSTAMEARDEYTQGHSLRVGKYAQCIGKAMNLSPKDMKTLGHAAILHDIGKIGIMDAILNKPAILTADEREIIQTHPRIAINIIGHTMIPEKEQEIILHHHEHFDGGGYPNGTKQDEISLLTYILCVADTFDAITSDRPYRTGQSIEAAMRILKENEGRQFHPEVVRVTLSIRDQIERILEEAKC